jgi:hypothetical protein
MANSASSAAGWPAAHAAADVAANAAADALAPLHVQPPEAQPTALQRLETAFATATAGGPLPAAALHSVLEAALALDVERHHVADALSHLGIPPGGCINLEEACVSHGGRKKWWKHDILFHHDCSMASHDPAHTFMPCTPGPGKTLDLPAFSVRSLYRSVPPATVTPPAATQLCGA